MTFGFISRLVLFLREHPWLQMFLAPDGTKCICALVVITSMIGWMIQSHDPEVLDHLSTPSTLHFYRTRWMALVPIK